MTVRRGNLKKKRRTSKVRKAEVYRFSPRFHGIDLKIEGARRYLLYFGARWTVASPRKYDDCSSMQYAIDVAAKEKI